MTQPTHLGDDILNALIDGIATDDERAIVADHLATCGTCARHLDELRLVKTMLADLDEVAPPRSFRLTPEQARKPTPIRPRTGGDSLIRMLPVVRTVAVAAMLTVIILGGALALRPAGDSLQDEPGTMSLGIMATSETGAANGSLEDETLGRGEVVDQGEAAAAHDSTSDAISTQAQDVADTASGGLTSLEVATIVAGVLAIVLGITWMGLSMSIRNGTSR